MKKAIDFFTAHPARFFLVAALLWGGFMYFLNGKDNDFNLHDLLVEANGMFFDLLVFGVLLYAYEAWREKRDKIERLQEEIDDYRGWDEKEAMYRIVGAVRRLNKLGVTVSIDLRNCYLENANLKGAKLAVVKFEGANLQNANLQGAYLKYAWSKGADLRGANLQSAYLRGAHFQGANLQWADLQWADLRAAGWETVTNTFHKVVASLEGADLRGADLRWANLQEANLMGANLEEAEVGKDWFKELEEWKVEGREQIKKKYLIDKNGVLREKQ